VLDKLEVIAGYARYPVAVLSDSQGKNIELISLRDDTDAKVPDLQARGLELIAAVGILNGEFQIAMVYPLDTDVAEAIGSAYAAYHRGILASKEPQYDWLNREYRPS
jgi:hypothetical protein